MATRTRTGGEGRYRLKRPCPKCPFPRTPGYLRQQRAADIAASIAGGSEFVCHESTVPDDSDDDDLGLVDDHTTSAVCAGSLILMTNAEQMNQAGRMAERFGYFSRDDLDLAAPVHDSLAAFVAHHGEDDRDGTLGGECCHVSGAGCLHPAGYLIGGHAVPVLDGEPTRECASCGEPVCEGCSDEDGVCDDCAEEP